MTVAYWVVAALLALVYLYSGGLKLLQSPGQLRPMMGWVDAMPLRLVRTIGVLPCSSWRASRSGFQPSGCRGLVAALGGD